MTKLSKPNSRTLCIKNRRVHEFIVSECRIVTSSAVSMTDYNGFYPFLLYRAPMSSVDIVIMTVVQNFQHFHTINMHKAWTNSDINIRETLLYFM